MLCVTAATYQAATAVVYAVTRVSLQTSALVPPPIAASAAVAAFFLVVMSESEFAPMVDFLPVTNVTTALF